MTQTKEQHEQEQATTQPVENGLIVAKPVHWEPTMLADEDVLISYLTRRTS